MEAILQANLTLTTHEQKILNNVCICLQANTLSDIVSHTGTHIRTECLHQEHPPNTRQHENPNHSTLQWPQHAPPSSANWKLWSRTLRKIFSSSNTSRLTQPLGSWTEHYDREYLWQWRICPTTYHLYHQHNHIWMVYKPSTLHHTSITYFNDPEAANSTQIPQTPVTPEHLPHGVQISLPVTPLQRQTQITNRSNPTLSQRLTTPCQSWATSLWHKI